MLASDDRGQATEPKQKAFVRFGYLNSVVPLRWLLLFFFLPSGFAQFRAFNDSAAGPATHSNATAYAISDRNTNQLRDIVTGTFLNAKIQMATTS